MQIQDFLPYYPPIDNELQKNIVFQKEFYDVVDADDPDNLRPHQRIIARFLSNYTTYNQILLYHQMGTGKTCASIAAIEEIQNSKDNTYKKAVILTPSSTLKRQYKTQVMLECMPQQPKNLNFYNYDTFCTFKGVTSRNTRTYDDTIFVIDEVHKLKDTPHAHRIDLDSPDTFGIGESPDKPYNFTNKDTIYIQSTKPFSYDGKNATRSKDDAPFKLSLTLDKVGPTTLRFSLKDIFVNVKLSPYSNVLNTLRKAKHTKVILMSGTPMTDSADEFLSIINLLNPLNPITKAQFKNGFTMDGFSDTIKNALYGKISYLRSKDDVNIQYNTNDAEPHRLEIDGKTFLPLYCLRMGENQNRVYTDAYTVQCDTADERCGDPAQAAGFSNQIQLSKISVSNPKVSNATLRANLAPNSCKFNKIIDIIKQNKSPENRHFIYCEFVQAGVEKLQSLLGAAYSVTVIKSVGKSSDTPAEIETKIQKFNQDTNFKKPKILISSRMISEGITLKNISHIHILTPHWNMAVIDQAIARGIRFKSHELLKQYSAKIGKPITTPTVNIYLYTALPIDPSTENALSRSIDYKKYTRSFKKDIEIKQVEKLLRDIAFDCNLHTFTNTIEGRQPNSRDCYYSDCGPPQCLSAIDIKSITQNELNTSSYNLYYSKYNYFYTKIFSLLQDPPPLFKTNVFSLGDIKSSLSPPLPSMYTLNNVVNHILFNHIVLFSVKGPHDTHDYSLADAGTGIYYISPIVLPNPTPIHIALDKTPVEIIPGTKTIPLPTTTTKHSTIPVIQPNALAQIKNLQTNAKPWYGVFIGAPVGENVPATGPFTLPDYISIEGKPYTIDKIIVDLSIPKTDEGPGEDESKGETPTQLLRGNLYLSTGRTPVGKRASFFNRQALREIADAINSTYKTKDKNPQITQNILQTLRADNKLVIVTV